MAKPSEALARLLAVLDRLEITYAVCGSVASSVHGIPRTTLDVDMMVDLKAELRDEKIDELASELAGDFYADAGLIREAFARGRAANLIHLETIWKFDLFPLQSDACSTTAFGRRLFLMVRPDGGAAVECAVISAEHTVLRKLEWYRAGVETSERQWNDLRGICRVVGTGLDVGCLRKWAGALRVEDLLLKLLSGANL